MPYNGEKDEDDEWSSFSSIAVYQKGPKTCLANAQGNKDFPFVLYDVETEAAVDDFKFDAVVDDLQFNGSEGAKVVTTYMSHECPILVSALANSVGQWNGNTGSTVGKLLTGHEAAVTAVASYEQPGGKVVIVSGSVDGSVRQWDAETCAELGGPLTGHSGKITSIATYEVQGRV